MGYGRSESRDGSVFQWNFPLLGTYWTAADIILQFIAGQERGWDKLRGKRIALVYHDSPYGKEPIAMLQKEASLHGFDTLLLPVTHPGVEQKATWLQVRQNRPDYLLLWGWGVMNSTAIKEAVAVGYPREKKCMACGGRVRSKTFDLPKMVPRDTTPSPSNTLRANSSCTRI